MSESARLAAAAVAAALWAGHAGWVARRAWRRRAPPPAAADAVLVAYASQTGFAARIAAATAAALADGGRAAHVLPLGQVDAAALAAARHALFVVATTGEGDPPDDAARFVSRVMARSPDLSHLAVATLALGDRSYRHYCRFGHALDAWLDGRGAARAADLIEVDNGDAGALRHWQQNLRLFGADGDAPDWTPPAYRAARLVARTLLNPGSPGRPVFRLSIVPDAPVDWQAGDIAELYPGPAADALVGTGALPHRDYSIASVPADGAIELVVRQMRAADGALGLGSGWLTERLAPDGAVALRLRANPGFRAPAAAVPMILIGSGTGIAGLRAHLKARGAGTRNWLLFGERTRAHDALFDAELAGWATSGHLARLDRCFSRDGGDGRYVQHLIDAHGDAIREWIGDGAALYVCGSLTGMAAGVDASLSAILGRDALAALAEAGRYRRDVY